MGLFGVIYNYKNRISGKNYLIEEFEKYNTLANHVRGVVLLLHRRCLPPPRGPGSAPLRLVQQLTLGVLCAHQEALVCL